MTREQLLRLLASIELQAELAVNAIWEDSELRYESDVKEALLKLQYNDSLKYILKL